MSNGGELRRTFLKVLETKDIPDEVSLPLILAGQIELYGFLKEVKEQSEGNAKRIIALGVVVGLALILIGGHLGIPLLSIIP